MRRLITVCLMFTIAVLASACNDGSSSRKFGGRTWSESLDPNDQALERAIISDVMGGIVSALIVPEEMTLSGLEDLDDMNKLTINVPLERSYTSVVDTYTYESESGVGSLTISVNGNVEALTRNPKADPKVRFFPIEVDFSFSDYDYTNSCGLHAVITGNISCRLQGTVNRKSDVIEATGSCSSGREGMTGTLMYTLSEEEFHDVFVQTTVRANGPWYELTSYQLYGNYMLDRRTGSIDSVVARAPQMCEY